MYQFQQIAQKKEAVEKDLMRNLLIDTIFHYTEKHLCYRFYNSESEQ